MKPAEGRSERKVKTMNNALSKKTNKDTNHNTVLGIAKATGKAMTLDSTSRLKHVYTIGKTGSGKTTFLKRLFLQDVAAGHGVCVIDFHGDLSEELLRLIPSDKVPDTIYFNAADKNRPIGFNPVQAHRHSEIESTVSDLMTTFEHQWGEIGWGPRMAQALRNTLFLIVTAGYYGEPTTLLSVTKVLTDREYRKSLMAYCNNQTVLDYWEKSFGPLSPSKREERINPVTNKFDELTSFELMQNILGQPNTKIDVKRVMDTGQILIVNLSKGMIGKDNANLLGSLIVSHIQGLAMARAHVPEDQRKPFFLYVDEFQNLSTKSFSEILSESRKYRLGLVLAHQYTDQIHEDIFNAIKGNVEAMMIFAISGGDADKYRHETKPFNSEELTGSSVGEAVFVRNATPIRVQALGVLEPAEFDDRSKSIKTRSRTAFGTNLKRLKKGSELKRMEDEMYDALGLPIPD